VHLSWAPDEAEAMAIAHEQWRTNVFTPPVPWDLETPLHFDVVGQDVTEEQVRRAVLVSSDARQHAEWVHDLVSLGFDEVYLHHVGQEQQRFIETFAEKVLPELRSAT
jgi:alkanesulfonate monooxygenase SsuD/methylene tetrahydromethanopterin reductase-like flavin-dependent oxidoreductase (luciferase family)